MSVQRAAGVLLILGSVALVAGAAGGPPGLYQTKDIGERLHVLQTFHARWIIERVASVLACLSIMAGFSLVAYHLWSTANDRWVLIGVLAFAAATLSALYFIYVQTSDPRGGYSGAYPLPENLAYWFWLVGMLFFGIAFLQGSFPDWLGVLAAGVALVYSLFFLITGVGALAPFVLSPVWLITGVVLLLM